MKKFIPLIVICTFVLLVLGAGAVAIAVQLRKNAPPTFTEVDRFLRRPPAASTWTYIDHKAGRPTSMRVGGWWSKFGLHRCENYQETTYTLSHNASTGRGRVTVGRSGDRIIVIQLTGSFAEQERELENTFFREFPKLRAHYSPGKPRP